MQYYVKLQTFFAREVEPEYLAEYFEVSRRTNWQELGKSLYQTHYQRIEYIHQSLFFARFKANGNSHHYKSEEANSGANHYAAGAEYVGVELFGGA